MTAIQTTRQSQLWAWMFVCLLAMFLVLAALTQTAGADSVEPQAQPAATGYIISPSSGIFFAGPYRGAEPYVSAGAKVETGTIVGNIEVWGKMHPVYSMLRGEVVEVLINDDATVEAWQPLFKIQIEKELPPT